MLKSITRALKIQNGGAKKGGNMFGLFLILELLGQNSKRDMRHHFQLNYPIDA